MSDRFFIRSQCFACVGVCMCVPFQVPLSLFLHASAVMTNLTDMPTGHSFFVISAVSPVVVCVTVSVLVLLFWIFMSFGSIATPRSLTVFLSCSFLPLSLPPIILSAVVWSHRGHSWRWDMARDWPVLQHRLNGAGQDQVVGRGIPAHHDHPREIVRPLRPPHALGTCRQCHLTEALMWRSSAAQKITAKNKALTEFCPTAAAPVIISEGAAVVSIPEIRLINSHLVSRLHSCTPSEALQDSWWSKTERAGLC